jgi:hypothetical protein
MVQGRYWCYCRGWVGVAAGNMIMMWMMLTMMGDIKIYMEYCIQKEEDVHEESI